MSQKSYNLGVFYENIVANFLENKGYKVLFRRFKTNGGEIDLILHNGNKIVFLEVKYRKRILDFEGIITSAKCSKIFICSELFLKQYPQFSVLMPAFEAIFIQQDNTIHHIDLF